MARHQRMPPLEAGYTYAVEPPVIKQVTCKRGGVHIRPLAHWPASPRFTQKRLLLAPQNGHKPSPGNSYQYCLKPNLLTHVMYGYSGDAYSKGEG